MASFQQLHYTDAVCYEIKMCIHEKSE